MSFSTMKELLSLTEEELTKEVLVGKKQLFDLRLKKKVKGGSQQSFPSHSFRHIKRRIRQALMLHDQKFPNSKRKA